MYGHEGDLWDVPLAPGQARAWNRGQRFEVMGLRSSHYRVTEVHDDHLVVELVAGKWKPRAGAYVGRLSGYSSLGSS